MYNKLPLWTALLPLGALACSSKPQGDSGTPAPPQGTVQISVDFLPVEDLSDYDLVANGDGKINPGEELYVGVLITNTGDVPLNSLYGTITFTDERLEGWEPSLESLGSAYPGRDNTITGGYAPGGHEVRLPPFDAGESGTRMNGTADIHAPCNDGQNPVIWSWCQSSGATVYPVYQGPVTLLVEEPAKGAEILRLHPPTVMYDTNNDGTAAPSETVSWAVDLSKTAEVELRNFTGALSCTDPYLSAIYADSFTDWTLSREDNSPRHLQLTGTLAGDTPDGHTFEIELSATDLLGDRHVVTVQTPPVASGEANLVFSRLEADSFVRPEDGEVARSNIPIDIIIENIGNEDLVNTWGELSSSDPIFRNGPYNAYGGNLSAGGGARYEYMVDLWNSELPKVYNLPLTILITDELEGAHTIDFDWTLYTVPTPVTGVVPTELSGNGNGTPNPGESIEVTVSFKAVVESRWSSGMRGEYTVTTADPNVRLSGDSTYTWTGIHEDDLLDWPIRMTLLSSHPGGDVTLELRSEVWENPEYVPPEWVDTQELQFTVE